MAQRATPVVEIEQAMPSDHVDREIVYGLGIALAVATVAALAAAGLIWAARALRLRARLP